MSERIHDAAVIEPEPARTCSACGKWADTRPYGPGGARICFDCAMGDEAGTRRRMWQSLFGERPN